MGVNVANFFQFTVQRIDNVEWGRQGFLIRFYYPTLEKNTSWRYGDNGGFG